MEFKNLHNFDPSVCISRKCMMLSRLTANVFRKYLRPFDITDSQLSILFILTKQGGLTQKQICDISLLEKSSLNRNLKRLLDKGYLTRKEFPLIRITEKGKKLINDIIPEWEKAMTEIREKLEEDGEAALDLAFNKLLNH